MIPKAENLERELELLDGKDTKDDDFIGQVDKLNKAMEESKAMVQKRDEEKKKKVEEAEKKENDEQYAFTPREGFDWDNVSDAVGDVI